MTHGSDAYRELRKEFIDAAAEHESEGYRTFIQRNARSEESYYESGRYDCVAMTRWPYKPWRECWILAPNGVMSEEPFAAMKSLFGKAWLWLPSVVTERIVDVAEYLLKPPPEAGLSWANSHYQMWCFLLWYDCLYPLWAERTEEPEVPPAGMDLRPFSYSADLIARWGLDGGVGVDPVWLGTFTTERKGAAGNNGQSSGAACEPQSVASEPVVEKAATEGEQGEPLTVETAREITREAVGTAQEQVLALRGQDPYTTIDSMREAILRLRELAKDINTRALDMIDKYFPILDDEEKRREPALGEWIKNARKDLVGLRHQIQAFRRFDDSDALDAIRFANADHQRAYTISDNTVATAHEAAVLGGEAVADWPALNNPDSPSSDPISEMCYTWDFSEMRNLRGRINIECAVALREIPDSVGEAHKSGSNDVPQPALPEPTAETDVEMEADAEQVIKKWGVKDFNRAAIPFFEENWNREKSITVREIATYLKTKNPAGTCSNKSVTSMRIWKAYQEDLVARTEGTTTSNTVSLSKAVEAKAGQDDSELKRLMAESERDSKAEPSPFDPSDKPVRCGKKL